jgi:hypothetical protein
MSKEAKFHISEYAKAKLSLLASRMSLFNECFLLLKKGNAVVRYNIPLIAENTIKSYWLQPSLILTVKALANSTTQ